MITKNIINNKQQQTSLLREIMQRLLKNTILLAAILFTATTLVYSQPLPIATISGRLAQNQIRVLTRDTLYQVAGHYQVAGFLIIEPGTTVEFLPNSRLIDSVGGKIIADGEVEAIWNRNTFNLLSYPERYCDRNYVMATVMQGGRPEPSIDPSSLNPATAWRKPDGNTVGNCNPQPNWMSYVPWTLFWYANRLTYCNQDPNLHDTPYRRDVTRAPIIFRGRPANRYSREWGHIVILPGADTAVFRNVEFVNFRKDTSVTNSTEFYNPNQLNGYNNSQILAGFDLNNEMKRLTSGGGGAITVFSSKTWLIDCRFDSCFARSHGGAVQFLQAPCDKTGLVYAANPNVYNNEVGALGYGVAGCSANSFNTNTIVQNGAFAANAAPFPLVGTNAPVNPETYDLYNTATSGYIMPVGNVKVPGMTSVPPTNLLISPKPAPGSVALLANPIQYRPTYDDGRMAANMGRIRRLIFRDNRVVVGATVDDVKGYRDTTVIAPLYNTGGIAKNEAYGGAVYVSGRRLTTVFFGAGQSLLTPIINVRIDNGGPLLCQTVPPPNDSCQNGSYARDPYDEIICERNHAVNFQAASVFTNGAKGGAFHIGDSSSMVFQRARFEENFTATPNISGDDWENRALLSQGGGIYMSSKSPRLTIKDLSWFINNKSGQGGGVYTGAIEDAWNKDTVSPLITGDSIYFLRNKAEYDGGAIYTQRNIQIESKYIFCGNCADGSLDRRIQISDNRACLSGGGVTIDNRTNSVNSRGSINQTRINGNAVGDPSSNDYRLILLHNPLVEPFGNFIKNFGTYQVRDSFICSPKLMEHVLGGGGVFSYYGNNGSFMGTEFFGNWVIGGNGGGLAMIAPVRSNRYLGASNDQVVGGEFFCGPEPKSQLSLTRFIRNYVNKDMVTPLNRNPRANTIQMGDPDRNGTGLGGAIYINDRQPNAPTPGAPRTDSMILHRVRVEQNQAWSGSAVYSDNYEMRVVMNRCLVSQNKAISTEGRNTDLVDNYYTDPVASRTVAATFYGECEGPLAYGIYKYDPFKVATVYSSNANSVYDNDARFILRLPDAPNNIPGLGLSGTDTVRGNYWGETQAPVTTILPTGTIQTTFFVKGNGNCVLPLKNTAIINQQGPFESYRKTFDPPGTYYTYQSIPIGIVPDTLLMEGQVYDIFDKGVDIKRADYSDPRLAPIEDFAVGIPARLRSYAPSSLGFTDSTSRYYTDKVVRRLTRDPFQVEKCNNAGDSCLGKLQAEFVGNHPIGYPMFLQSCANYTGCKDTLNDDPYSLNHSVFYVVNVETGEFIRSTMKQKEEGNCNLYSRVEFVPDSNVRNPLARRSREERAAFSYNELYRLTPQYYLENHNGNVPPVFLPKITDDAVTAKLKSISALKWARHRAAEVEDSAALLGRRYGNGVADLGGPGFGYWQNNPSNASFGTVKAVTYADYYAGDRYQALPVINGDRVVVVSRTNLWEVLDSIAWNDPNRWDATDRVLEAARVRGLEFQISTNVLPPVIFGQRDSLENKTPAELRNSRFLVEDKVYQSDPTGVTRSEILDATAYDINKFYDPLSCYFPDKYLGLKYEWSPLQECPNVNTTKESADPKLVRLASWLKSENVYPNQPGQYVDPVGENTRGFLRFWGTPHNPDVVPGGELLQVKVSNYAPDARIVDHLKGILADSVVAKYVFIYKPYYNCEQYDVQTARYLQQDSIDFSQGSTATYRLRIFVQDTPPVFKTDVTPCPLCLGKVTANLTDKLRFNYDVVTDDEQEDDAAEVEGWDFRYGRTTYGFKFTDRNASNIDNNQDDDVTEVRPTWMADKYLTNKNLTPDQGVSVTKNGNIIVRIPKDEAFELLKNPAQSNIVYNFDTTFTVFVNDGHTGQNYKNVKVIVNVPPVLQEATLPNAKEDFEYNPELRDYSKSIMAVDRNYNQRVRYSLIYKNDANNESKFQNGASVKDENGTVRTNDASTAFLSRDPCYQEAGVLTASKTTPSWLKINPVSGILYGTPGINDAPRGTVNGCPQEVVTVVAVDECGLMDVKSYNLNVDSTNHRPRFYGRPAIVCVDADDKYEDSICVTDKDLLRLKNGNCDVREKLQVQITDPAGVFTATPSTINGDRTPDSICIKITAASIPASLRGKKLPITVKVTDLAGNTDQITYEISVSEPLVWKVGLDIVNTVIDANRRVAPNAYQKLTFGSAQNATTGDENANLGNLDEIYCEYELPPLPPRDVFDTRWTVVTRNGVLRNIFPGSVTNTMTWKATFQAGNLQTGSPNYPVRISWKKAEADNANKKMGLNTPDGLYLTDQNQSYFAVDMANGAASSVIKPGVELIANAAGDSLSLVIKSTLIEGFKIVTKKPTLNEIGGVDDAVTGSGFTLSSSIPNPFSTSTQITVKSQKSAKAIIEVYDVNGKAVATLFNGTFEAGSKSYIWNGKDNDGKSVGSGVYSFRLYAGGAILTRKVVLTK